MRRLAALCLCAACGYAPVRGAPGKGLRVLPVKNDTAQAEAGGIFAGAVRDELAGRGRLDPDGAASPEMLLELISLTSLPTSSAGEGAASFVLVAELKLTVGAWEDRFRGSEDYITGMDVLGTEANRRAALRRLARGVVREGVERYEVYERLR